jgi:hypothetical protein
MNKSIPCSFGVWPALQLPSFYKTEFLPVLSDERAWFCQFFLTRKMLRERLQRRLERGLDLILACTHQSSLARKHPRAGWTVIVGRTGSELILSVRVYITSRLQMCCRCVLRNAFYFYYSRKPELCQLPTRCYFFLYMLRIGIWFFSFSGSWVLISSDC